MPYLPYSPDQAYLLAPNVKDELGADHLCFFIHQVVERMDLSAFEQEYSAEGQRPYPPQMMLKLWLYAYLMKITSSRQLERKIVEDLSQAFAGCKPIGQTRKNGGAKAPPS